MAAARERLELARADLAAGFPAGAAGAGYYAMLYAARAALSEEELNARTHSGVWHLFRETFVATDRFPEELVSAAQQAQGVREAADYEARSVSHELAEAIIAQGERFVSTVAALFGG